MKKARFTKTQIVGILNEAEAGMKVKDLCRKHGISRPPLGTDTCYSGCK